MFHIGTAYGAAMTTSLKNLTAGQRFRVSGVQTVYTARYVKVGVGRTFVDYVIDGSPVVFTFHAASLTDVEVVR